MLVLGRALSRSRGTVLTVNISSSTNNVDIHTLAEAEAGKTLTDPYTVNVTVADGVVVGSTSISTYAMDFTNMPAGSTATLFVGAGAYIVGKGGDGPGGNGGPAINTNVDLAISGTGTIGSGGGAGTNGGTPSSSYRTDTWYDDPNNGCQTTTGSTTTLYGTPGYGGGGAGTVVGSSSGNAGTLTTGGAGTAAGSQPGTPSPSTSQCPGTNSGTSGTFYPVVGGSAGSTGNDGGDLGQDAPVSGGVAGTSINGFATYVSGVGSVTVSGPTA